LLRHNVPVSHHLLIKYVKNTFRPPKFKLKGSNGGGGDMYAAIVEQRNANRRYDNTKFPSLRGINIAFIVNKLSKMMRDGAYAVPATKNSAPEVSTLGILAGVNRFHVQ